MPKILAPAIIITRPARQAQSLARRIQELGGRPIIFPTLEILPPADPARLFTVMSALPAYQFGIFVSANVVNFLPPFNPAALTRLTIIAVGAGTAQTLRAHHIAVNEIPESHNSEGILALPSLQNVAGSRIAIFCGEKSRPLLKTILTQRGALVDEIICYRRCCPQVDAATTLAQWRKDSIAAIVSTSSASLANLWQLFGKLDSDWLCNRTLLVISPSMAAQAQQWGFRSVIVANGASDEAIGEALKEKL